MSDASAQSKPPTDGDIDASPTKEFFIRMLTRDVPLDRAILDLIDNSVDAARAQDATSYVGREVKLVLDKDRFSIVDNCGGMSVRTARDIAFRFGRPSSAPQINHSIGRFGVGMKRTLFKLGRIFVVESTTTSSHFTVRIDVAEWTKDDHDWKFAFQSVDEGANHSAAESGTKVVVTQLHPQVAAQFQQDQFLSELKVAIVEAHSGALTKGLKMYLNGVQLQAAPFRLRCSGDLVPLKGTYNLDIDGQELRLTIIAGVADREYSEGGWYVFCNDRLVLAADQTMLTGWRNDGIPGYHADYAWFRGFAFFDADDAEVVPWNTTKTSLDVDSEAYVAGKFQMMAAMRPVVGFLKNLVKEISDHKKGLIVEDAQLLTAVLETAKLTPLADIPESKVFAAPDSARRIRPRPKMGNVLYQRPVAELEAAKQALKVTSNKDVGLGTFRYFMKREGLNGG